ncbi:hypothetical protein [Streptomyces sp. DH12]|uniref:hypothetical protein n=1 Tax=Streptomyces sp. DH12 TaxID=2857010 RepID=UPI001E5A1748|nr:hypothetical protein [Streptomyces sp. DH12]
MSCLLPLLLGYPMLRAARSKARQVFPSDGWRGVDPRIGRVQAVRAWGAAAASVLILAAYGTAADWDQAQEQFVMRLALTPWLLLLTAPVVVVAVFRLAPPAMRPRMRSGLRPVVRAVLWYLGALSAPVVLLVVLRLIGEEEARWEVPKPVIAVVLLLLLVLLVWAAMFLAFASARAVRGAFNAAGVHPVLPALLTGVLVWELAGINLYYAGPPPGPPLVQWCALLGGPASVTAVAWWEMRRLRVRYGVTVRG